MRKLINRLRRDDEGAALVEYGMLVGLIAVVCIIAVKGVGTEVNDVFSYVSTQLATIIPA